MLRAPISLARPRDAASHTYCTPTAHQDYFEIDIDIHTWGAAPLSAFNTLKGSLPSMLLRGGVVIEADTDDEMPENILAAVNITHIDVNSAPPVASEVAAFLNDQANHVPPLERLRRNGRSSLLAHGPAGAEPWETGGEHSDHGGLHSDPGDAAGDTEEAAGGGLTAPSTARSECPDVSDSQHRGRL